MKLRAALNTQVYLGGSPAPFDRTGDEVYQLSGWASDAKLETIVFLLKEGDARAACFRFYDRHGDSPSAILLYEAEVRSNTNFKLVTPVRLAYTLKGRLYVRITALDGEQSNHCIAAFIGSSFEELQAV